MSIAFLSDWYTWKPGKNLIIVQPFDLAKL